MTAVASLTGQVIYLDTNVLIHFVEGHPKFGTVLTQLFREIDQRQLHAVTSKLSLAEVLVKPIADAKPAVAASYETLLSVHSAIRILPIDRSILIESARLRATLGGRAFDAIHVATAANCGCSILLTEDTRVRAPSTIKLLRLSDLR